MIVVEGHALLHTKTYYEIRLRHKALVQAQTEKWDKTYI